MTITPYVGITGFMSPYEVERVDSILDDLKWPWSHRVMYGRLVSGWTLEGSQPSNPRRYAPLEVEGQLRSEHPRAFNVVHFNNQRQPAALDHQLRLLKEKIRSFDGVQLNFSWPNPMELRRIRNTTGSIILQLGARAMREAGSEAAAVDWLRSYSGVADYVLLDLSGGVGRSIDIPYALRVLELFKRCDDAYGLSMGFGVAGGLDGSNVAQIAPLVADYPWLSWDAEARLRDEADHLDPNRCRQYLAASLELIGSIIR